MCGGEVSREAAVGQVVSLPDTSPHVFAPDSGRKLSGTHQLPGPQLSVDSDDGALCLRKAVFLPLESPSSSRAEEVSAPFTRACTG